MEEFAQVGRELEAELAPHGNNLGKGQAGARLYAVVQGVAGRVLPAPVLGAGEIAHQFLSNTAIHLRLASTLKTKAQF